MKFPRVRLTVGRMMVAMAVVALGLLILQEFRDGLPPRFVIRNIPARIRALRPGMTWEETQAILGLEKSWLVGGIGGRFEIGFSNAHNEYVNYYLRPPRPVALMARVGGGGTAPMLHYDSPPQLQLVFSTNGILNRRGEKRRDWRRDRSTRLERASFSSSDLTTTVEMPGSR